jgi:site-specific recombinase XerD
LIKDASEEQGLQTTRKYKISRERLNKDIERAKYFPEELFWNFIERFRLRGATDADPIEKRLNLRNVLITLLLHYGGLRLSEPFHLFTSDIKFSDGDSDMAIVEIHHPYDGQPPEGAKGFSTRAEYLLKKYQLYPRNAVEGRGASYGAGWKGMQLNRLGFAKVYWFYEEAGRYFFHLLRLYLQFQRMPSNDHPFLFTNLDGSPFSISSYNDAHEHAFKRLKTGLEYNKSNGVTSHGHRHAYGTRLTVHGVDELTIKNCMRHRSIESQQTYKTQSENDIQAELHTAHIRPARTSELNIPDYNDPLIFARDFNPFER